MQDISYLWCVMTVLSMLWCSEALKKVRNATSSPHQGDVWEDASATYDKIHYSAISIVECNFINPSICASIITVTLKHVFSVSTSEMWSIATYFMHSIPLYTINRNQKHSKFKIKYQWFRNRNDIAEYSDIVTKWISLFNK
jgi:hypothetical protein